MESVLRRFGDVLCDEYGWPKGEREKGGEESLHGLYGAQGIGLVHAFLSSPSTAVVGGGGGGRIIRLGGSDQSSIVPTSYSPRAVKSSILLMPYSPCAVDIEMGAGMCGPVLAIQHHKGMPHFPGGTDRIGPSLHDPGGR